jgi:ABC-type cobalamin transport system permease subunit
MEVLISALVSLVAGAVLLEPIQEDWIHEQRVGLVKRLRMRRIMARRMKATTVRA